MMFILCSHYTELLLLHYTTWIHSLMMVGGERNYLSIQGLFQQFVACDYRTQSPALFQNIFKFFTFLPKFSNILPFFALSLKNHMHALTF